MNFTPEQIVTLVTCITSSILLIIKQFKTERKTGDRLKLGNTKFQNIEERIAALEATKENGVRKS